MINSFKLTCLLVIVTTISLWGCSDTNPVKTEDNTKTNRTENSSLNAIWPQLDISVKTDPDVEKRVANILSKMSLEQKVAQMIQPEIKYFSVEDMRRYGFGSYLNGGGTFPNNNKHSTPADWIALADAMYEASIDDSLDGSSIPTMWGTDAVHGHNNVIGATLFPHNIGLGAANNPSLIEAIARVTAREVMVTGIDWVFAPTVAVVRDDRWGRTYEGYSEDPAIVKAYSKAIVTGLQGAYDDDFLSEQRVLATVKHFLGDGGTVDGDDQGDNIATEQELFDVHAQGYVGGLEAGAQTVMASFNSWHGKKNHGNKYLLTDVLKTRMGFDGLVVGDWNGHGQIKGCTNENCSQAVNAGLDIYMVPTKAWKPLLENTIAQVKSGEISQERIDDAVSRILRVKVRAGLFDKAGPAKRPLSGKTELIGSEPHREVARQAVRESLVLLKNKGGILPLAPDQHVLVTGDGADNLGKQTGGWTITWQGTNNKNQDFPGGRTIYSGIKEVVEAAEGTVELSLDGNYATKPDVAIVVFGEEPYAEGNGDIDNLEYQRGNKKDLVLLKKLQAADIPVISIFISGRPMWVNPELNASTAFVAAWLPGSEGHAIADVIFSKPDGTLNHNFKGKLSFSWPKTAHQSVVNLGDENYEPLLKYGFGLQYGDNNFLADNLDETVEDTSGSLTALDIFKLAVQPPWQFEIGVGDDNEDVTANVQTNGAVTISTLDRNVQQDARMLSFKELSRVSLTSNFPSDLRSYGEANSSLTFSIKPIRMSSRPIHIEMRCEVACDASIDITELVNAIEPGSWGEISLDMSCFVKAGANIARIYSPFSLVSSGNTEVAISDIRLVPNSAENATISCQ